MLKEQTILEDNNMYILYFMYVYFLSLFNIFILIRLYICSILKSNIHKLTQLNMPLYSIKCYTIRRQFYLLC